MLVSAETREPRNTNPYQGFVFFLALASPLLLVASAWRVNGVIDLLFELGESVLRNDVTSINGYNT